MNYVTESMFMDASDLPKSDVTKNLMKGLPFHYNVCEKSPWSKFLNKYVEKYLEGKDCIREMDDECFFKVERSIEEWNNEA